MNKTIIGIFDDRGDVDGVIGKLQSEGFNPKDISIVMKDKPVQGDVSANPTAESTVSGAATGGLLGGIAGLLAGTVIPGLGGFLIGGPIGAAFGLTGAAATTLSGVVTGAVAGGLLGALLGLGLEREDATYYEQRVREGAVLVAVPTIGDEDDIVREIFDGYNAQDVKTITHGRSEYRVRPTREEIPSHGYAMGAKGGLSKRPQREK